MTHSKPGFPLFLLAAILVSLLTSSHSVPANGELIAERITASNAGTLLVESPDRHGGIGDWYLANDVVWAIIDDVSNLNTISPTGGTLIDIGHVGKDGEQFTQMMQILNMTRDLIIPYDRIRVDSGDDWASITVSTSSGLRPEFPGFGVLDLETAEKISVETEYKLIAGENFLRIKTTVANNGNKRSRIFYLGDIIYWGDDTLKPFAGSQKKLGRAHGSPRGFQHSPLDTNSMLSLVQATGGFTYIAGGGVNGLPPISYGLCSPAEYKKDRFLWGINDRLVSVAGIFTGEFDGLLDFWKVLYLGISPGEQLKYERVIVVGDNNDVASATDTIFRLLGRADGRSGVIGRIEPPEADTSVLVCSTEGLPVTQIRPGGGGEPAGFLKAMLPPGSYTAEIRSMCRDPDLETPEIEPIVKRFKVDADGYTDIGTVTLPPLSTLLVEVFEGEKHLPARVIIHGSSGTPDPELGSDLLDFSVGGELSPSTFRANWILLDGNETEPVRVGLRPGKYTLYATHGFEYSADSEEVDLSRPGSETEVKMHLDKVIDTPGMMSGDFHVHSEASMDSAFPQEQRVISFVAEGVDLLVATDHDILTDYRPVISRLNLSHRITSMVGVEATSMLMLKETPFTIGHYNSWPLRYDSRLPRHGMIIDEGIRPRELFERLAKIGDGRSLIQVNHGRGREPDGGASYFNAMSVDFNTPVSYNPSKPLTESPNSSLLLATADGTRDIDFDAMELLNGSAYDEYLLLRNDWFSLLNQGYVKTATANSDTHIKAGLAGYPRNYILLKDPTAERDEGEAVMDRIRGQKILCSTGPVINFNINGNAGIGDLITARGGDVTLDIKILAAPWVPLDEVRIFANGHGERFFKIPPGEEIVRFNQNIPFLLKEDTWFVVETTTSNPDKSQIPQPPGGLYNIVAPGFVPIAFTNPIFVDVDGNGRYDAPGIPRSSVVTLPPWQIKASVVAAFLAIVSVVSYLRRKRETS